MLESTVPLGPHLSEDTRETAAGTRGGGKGGGQLSLVESFALFQVESSLVESFALYTSAGRRLLAEGLGDVTRTAVSRRHRSLCPALVTLLGARDVFPGLDCASAVSEVAAPSVGPEPRRTRMKEPVIHFSWDSWGM